MAKTNTNKQKLWRREAKESNLKQNKKHTGRSLKNNFNFLGKMPSPLVYTLLQRGGHLPMSSPTENSQPVVEQSQSSEADVEDGVLVENNQT